MPPLPFEQTWFALDMAGCPNRCRHCYLGYPPQRRLSVARLRAVDRVFRENLTPPPWQRLTAMSWFREPDYHPQYRRLYEVEAELNQAPPTRFELLSMWRLARDADYAPWAREIGTAACQVTLFGLGETHDWFVRRRGAFADALLATERLLEAGIAPRWQVFLTRRILPELDELLRLAERLRLAQRVAALGREFVLFLNTPTPDGAGWELEPLRPTVADLARVSRELLARSAAHLGHPLGVAEGELVARLQQDVRALPATYTQPERVGFYVTAGDEVFTNCGDLSPWWSLGNLRRDGLATILRRYAEDAPPGLWAMYHVPVAELAAHYGSPQGERLYATSDLVARWVHQWAKEKLVGCK